MPSTMRSLSLFLCKPKAALTQLSISITGWGPIPDSQEEWGLWPTCDVLQEAGDKLSELAIPCAYIGTSLCAVREFLPHVRSLVLNVDSSTDANVLDDTDFDDSDSEDTADTAEMFSSQLTSLTLQAPPGILPPVFLFDVDAELPLQLQRYPRLQHLILVGPLVGDAGEPPFLLPADAKVSRVRETCMRCWASIQQQPLPGMNNQQYITLVLASNIPARRFAHPRKASTFGHLALCLVVS